MHQQKYQAEKVKSFHALLLNKIDNENAKIKMLVNSFRDRAFKEDEFSDSDLSKNDILYQNQSFKRESRAVYMNNSRLSKANQQLPRRNVNGEDIIIPKKTNYFNDKRKIDLGKLYQPLTPIDRQSRSRINNPQVLNNNYSQNQLFQRQNNQGASKRMSMFRIKSKMQEPLNRRQAKSRSVVETKKRVEFKKQEIFRIQLLDSKLLISHLNTLEFLSVDSPPEAIFTFFQSIYQALRIPKVLAPIIKRYKNCIFYGEKQISQGSIYRGMIWYYKSSFYLGQLLDSKKHGYGIQVKFEKGEASFWKGKFQKGIKNGYFQIVASTYKYCGKLKEGRFEGEGHLITPQSEYKGNFSDGLKEGSGLEKHSNKAQYRGEYFNDRYDGHGELKAPNYYYKGLFKKGFPDGHGFQRTNEYQYLGNFVMGQKQGKGKLQTSDGVHVECLFSNGLIVQQKGPKHVVLEQYMSKQLHALNQESEEGTIQHMLNQINNESDLRLSPIHS